MHAVRDYKHSKLPVAWSSHVYSVTIRRLFTDLYWRQFTCESITCWYFHIQLISLILAYGIFSKDKEICLRGIDSQVPKVCNDKDFGGCGQRKLTIRIYIFE
ncbi:hypothetical protein AVEN_219773-1 [Araneus ventricosus]|uniref:Uncharacterized protein n=1 Tax=Araneus ventricosus TaxID=182803 RepID=A0A4Y2PEJ3_ARAVE|nr:hypothetical protein AVEN_219773-1 [Araneus ventricosus]